MQVVQGRCFYRVVKKGRSDGRDGDAPGLNMEEDNRPI